MWWWSDTYGMMPWIFMPLMMLLFMAMCAAMMFFMMQRRGHGRRKSTIEMLDESRALGEINETQYQQLKQILQS
jgi:uncharacterized membrane protein